MIKIKQLQDKKIAFLGLGVENQALIKYLLKKKIKCEMTICDTRSEEQLNEKLQVVFGNMPSLIYRQSPLRRDSAATAEFTGRVLRGETLPQQDGEPPFARGERGDYSSGIIIKMQLGKKFNKNLDKFDILFRSPGWPIFCPGIQEALKAGRELSSPMKLFFELCPTKNIIGVTGTKGKGTTSSLIYAILKKGLKRSPTNGAHANKNNNIRVWLGGNIGTAPFEFIDKIKKNDWVVLELSSFQLEDMTASPRIAVITNFYKEHLAPADPNNPNYHKTLKSYWEAKMNVLKWQSENDYAIINSKIQDTRYKIQKNSKIQIPNDKQIPNSKFQISNLASKLIYFTKSELPSRLIGEHNKENIAAAVEAAKIIGIKNDAIKKAVAGFKGLEYRLEFVKEINGVKYYNDSFATTPEASITALKSFDRPIILLAGGADKGADFKQLAEEVKKRVKFVVLLEGKATPRLKKALQNIGYEDKRMKTVKNISNALKIARENAIAGDIVLLSTACASFGMFKNYKERGRLFKDEMLKL